MIYNDNDYYCYTHVDRSGNMVINNYDMYIGSIWSLSVLEYKRSDISVTVAPGSRDAKLNVWWPIYIVCERGVGWSQHIVCMVGESSNYINYII
jgi:hypothetical protein